MLISKVAVEQKVYSGLAISKPLTINLSCAPLMPGFSPNEIFYRNNPVATPTRRGSDIAPALSSF